MDTPYQWTKQVASHWGGTRTGTIMHWPQGIQAKGEVRNQFHHVIDVAPTVLEAAGLPQPVMVNGVQQKPYEGVSMVYSFDDPQAPDRHETQYFEIVGNRGIYHKGWTAVTKHRTPWATAVIKTVPFDDDVWELYDTNTDWSQAHDLSKHMPDRLHALQRLWLIEAAKYNVLPLDDRFMERGISELAGRPALIRGHRQLLFSGMGHLTDNTVVNIFNKTYAVTAEITVPEIGAAGVILAHGGMFGGYSLYAKDGKLKYCYNFMGLERFYVETDHSLPAGTHQARMEFAYDGGGLGKGGTVSLYLDGQKVGEGRVEKTCPFGFSVDETCDVGRDMASPVSPDYGPRGNAFNGEVNWVEIDVDKEALDQDHFLTGEERFHIAMARQ